MNFKIFTYAVAAFLVSGFPALLVHTPKAYAGCALGERLDPFNRNCPLIGPERQTLKNGSDDVPDSAFGKPSGNCFFVDSRKGWQYFQLPKIFTRVDRVVGRWSVDDRNYARVGSNGHLGEAATRLQPYNQYKYDPQLPFGALLIEIPTGAFAPTYTSINGPMKLPSRSENRIGLRINDADNALRDNGGALSVCFGQ
jgi:hypothetical protein